MVAARAGAAPLRYHRARHAHCWPHCLAQIAGAGAALDQGFRLPFTKDRALEKDQDIYNRTFDYAIGLHGKEVRSSGVPVRANSLVVDTLDFNIFAVTESSSGVTI